MTDQELLSASGWEHRMDPRRPLLGDYIGNSCGAMAHVRVEERWVRVARYRFLYRTDQGWIQWSSEDGLVAIPHLHTWLVTRRLEGKEHDT